MFTAVKPHVCKEYWIWKGDNMGILDIKIVQDYIRMCTDGWEQGWHERNGGNPDLRMKESEAAECGAFFRDPGPWVDMGVAGENLAGGVLSHHRQRKILSRNAALDPEHSIGMSGDKRPGGTHGASSWGLEGAQRAHQRVPPATL